MGGGTTSTCTLDTVRGYHYHLCHHHYHCQGSTSSRLLNVLGHCECVVFLVNSALQFHFRCHIAVYYHHVSQSSSSSSMSVTVYHHHHQQQYDYHHDRRRHVYRHGRCPHYHHHHDHLYYSVVSYCHGCTTSLSPQ